MQGEIVVIPAGCAHQVVNGSRGHNIKVAQDFVAPESALVSLELLDEVKPYPLLLWKCNHKYKRRHSKTLNIFLLEHSLALSSFLQQRFRIIWSERGFNCDCSNQKRLVMLTEA